MSDKLNQANFNLSLKALQKMDYLLLRRFNTVLHCACRNSLHTYIIETLVPRYTSSSRGIRILYETGLTVLKPTCYVESVNW